ncbi:hypothetical protein LTR85_004425 [Meristemomyces frigidus]|nr:hypothetical protein LTR85_004425 [Meristemomyces frigidus]
MVNAFTMLMRVTNSITLDKVNPNYQASLDRDIFKIDGVEYMRKSAIASKSKSKKRSSSKIWAYGESLVRQTDAKEVYYCWICERQKKSQQLMVLNGTPKKQQTEQPISFHTVVTTYYFDQFKELLIHWFV